jgi:hypothetical protein
MRVEKNMLAETGVEMPADDRKNPIRILFLCLARDCADTIPLFFKYLERLEACGFSCTAIIGENGSSDRTRALIEEVAGQTIALLDTSLMKTGGSRLSRMAIGRQALLEAAEARRVFGGYVCVMDLDNIVVAPPDPLAVRSAIEQLHADASLFAIGATSVPVYYDLLSLRVEGFEFLTNLNREIAQAKKNPISYFSFHKERIYKNQKLITSSIPVLCSSSFNGFCCYNASDYRLGSYRSPDEADVCEHASFNLSIGNSTGKNMLISSELVLQAPADHVPVGFFRFWSDRIRKLTTRISLMRQRR